jgi:hypothetical protein
MNEVSDDRQEATNRTDRRILARGLRSAGIRALRALFLSSIQAMTSKTRSAVTDGGMPARPRPEQSVLQDMVVASRTVYRGFQQPRSPAGPCLDDPVVDRDEAGALAGQGSRAGGP